MLKHPIDIIAVCVFVAAGGLAAFTVPLGALFPRYGPTIINAIALITAVAGCIVRVYGNPIGAPATSIVAGAPVVAPKPASKKTLI
jgi:hypothetical protein